MWCHINQIQGSYNVDCHQNIPSLFFLELYRLEITYKKLLRLHHEACALLQPKPKSLVRGWLEYRDKWRSCNLLSHTQFFIFLPYSLWIFFYFPNYSWRNEMYENILKLPFLWQVKCINHTLNIIRFGVPF